MNANRDAEDRYWKAFGVWVRERRAAQKPDRWTQQRLADELARIDSGVSRNWIVQIERGDKPSVDLRRGIERLFGPFPEPNSGDTAIDLPGLVEALAAQTAAINALVKVLRPARDFDVRLAALEGTAAFLAPTSGGGSQEHELPLVGEGSGR